jgi:hypothetical protein
MHNQWKPIKIKIVNLLNQQTLGKLAAAVRSGKYRLTELPFAALDFKAGEEGGEAAFPVPAKGARGRRAAGAHRVVTEDASQ